MDLKIRVYLVLLVLGIALHHVQAAGKCDWPLGTCTYIYDPCPPDWERCDQYDKDCPLATNHCCCRKNPPIVADEPKKPRAQPAPRLCDWPRGTCTYIHDPCPPDWELCPQYDDCPLSTNHCCCRKRKPSIPPPWTPRPPPPWTPQPPKNLCDWPRGTCTYIHDPCPPNWERCSQYDSGCTSPTNHCCCRRKRLEADEPKKSPRLYQDVAAPCDWPYGTCTYTKDPCPPNWIRCPGRDSGCSLPTNHCCCRTTPTPPPGKCDWPRGTCTYYKDPCPPNWERCADYDIDCKLKTNHCCCRKETSVREAAKPCDWPIGTCTHKGEACPPGWKRCKKNDGGCKNPENQCCCRP